MFIYVIYYIKYVLYYNKYISPEINLGHGCILHLPGYHYTFIFRRTVFRIFNCFSVIWKAFTILRDRLLTLFMHLKIGNCGQFKKLIIGLRYCI